jgi:hypothetical protein
MQPHLAVYTARHRDRAGIYNSGPLPAPQLAQRPTTCGYCPAWLLRKAQVSRCSPFLLERLPAALPDAHTSTCTADVARPPSGALQRPAGPRGQTPAGSMSGAYSQTALSAPGSSGAALADRDYALGGDTVHRAAHGPLAGEARDGLRGGARTRTASASPPGPRLDPCARDRLACRPAAARAAGKRAAARPERAATAARAQARRSVHEFLEGHCTCDCATLFSASAFGRRQRPRRAPGLRALTSRQREGLTGSRRKDSSWPGQVSPAITHPRSPGLHMRWRPSLAYSVPAARGEASDLRSGIRV